MKKTLGLILFLAGIGCGGGGGVSDGTFITDLTVSEQDSVCDYVSGGASLQTDCNGTTVTTDPESLTDCENNFDDIVANDPNCLATVGDAKDCADDEEAETHDELCDPTFIPESCKIFLSADCT